MGNETAQGQGDYDSHFAPASPPKGTAYRHARSAWAHNILMRPVHAVEQDPTAQQHPHRSGGEPQGQVDVQLVDARLVTVVGVCSAGKSTLVKALRERGYKARSVAQEHSYVPYLWQRSRPDVLIYLDASLPTIRRRRNVRWHRPVLDEEHRRLSHAREHAHLYIHTDGLSPYDVAARAVTYLNNSKEVMRSET